MREDENIVKYSDKIKALGGNIEDEIVVSKFLITLLLTYSIKALEIQEMRCNPKNNITLDAIVGRLTAIELDNYDNYVPSSSNLESTFKAKLSLKKKATKYKKQKI